MRSKRMFTMLSESRESQAMGLCVCVCVENDVLGEKRRDGGFYKRGNKARVFRLGLTLFLRPLDLLLFLWFCNRNAAFSTVGSVFLALVPRGLFRHMTHKFLIFIFSKNVIYLFHLSNLKFELPLNIRCD